MKNKFIVIISLFVLIVVVIGSFGLFKKETYAYDTHMTEIQPQMAFQLQLKTMNQYLLYNTKP